MNIFKHFRSALEIEFAATYLLAPVFISIGIVIFFALPNDPPWLMCILPLAITSALSYLFRHHSLAYRACLFMVAISIGFLACELRVLTVKAPRITEQLQHVEVVGTIVQIVDTANARKLLLDNLEIEGLDTMPEFIRISLKSDISGLAIGDRVSLTATLMPPPHPSTPNGFNFAQYTYFKKIGAIGYATSRPHLLESDNMDTSTKYINAVRHYIGSRIESRIDAKPASIALALLVGDTSKIPIADLTMIRISGIAHIIAISGLHVVIIVGLIFLSTRFLLSRIEPLATHYDLKKIASVLGIIGNFIYLIIAGSPISAQRAFIMSTIMLVAIIIDRNGSPMRSIATAAITILLLTPENLFTPSLQMSFAACIALISGFAATQRLFKTSGKVWSYFLGIVISTLLAGTATTPFVIYHFNQFSTYSLLTNLFAIPLTNFIIMPLGVASLLLMPLHLDWLTLPAMAVAINLMLWVATAVSALPEASIHIPSYTALGLGLIALGGALLCMMATRLRLTGIPLILAGMLSNITMFKGADPDLMIDTRGKLFAIKMDDSYYFSNKMNAKFVRKSWEQTFGVSHSSTIRNLDNCNHFHCILSKHGHNLTILYNSKHEPSSCINLVNLTNNMTNCKELVTLKSLSEQGNTFIWLSEDGIKIQTVAGALKRRVWNHFKF